MNGPDQVLHGTEIGEQVRPNKLSMHKVKLAMAIRTKNADWRMKDIQPRHWMEIGKRYGVLDDRRRTAEVLIDEVMAGLEPAIAKVQAGLPAGFPEHVAAPIFDGLRQAARKFEA